MLRHHVEQGDTVTSLGFRYGFFPETIWNHPANAQLKQLRVNGDILFPGDEIAIPDLRPDEFQKPTDQRHRFRRKGVPARLRLQLLEANGPRASVPFSLSIDNLHQMSGSTDADGVIEIFIPPNSVQAELRVGLDVYPILLGQLDPISELSGVKKRLNNLGFFCGPSDNPELDEAFEIALRRFQQHLRLDVTGELSPATRSELERIHDLRNAIPPIPLED